MKKKTFKNGISYPLGQTLHKTSWIKCNILILIFKRLLCDTGSINKINCEEIFTLTYFNLQIWYN